jgi:hypothetical protein
LEFIRKTAWYGVTVTIAAIMALALLFAGPADKAFAGHTAVISTSTVADELSVTVTVTGLAAGTDQVSTLTSNIVSTGGTFTITFQGQTTSGIAHNANAATIETAFEGLSTVGSGNGTVASVGNADTAFAEVDVVTITMDVGHADPITIISSMTGSGGAAVVPTVTITAAFVASVDAVTITIDPASTGTAEFSILGAQSLVLLDGNAADTDEDHDEIGIAIKAKSAGVVLLNVTSKGDSKTLAFNVTAVTAVASITLGTPSPTQVPAAGGTGADITVVLKSATGVTLTGATYTVTSSLGVVASNATDCDISADGTADTNSDASCKVTNSQATDVIEIFGNGITGTATITVTSGTVTATKSVTLTGGTVSSIVLDLVRTNSTVSFVAKGIIADRQSTTTELDELLAVARTLDADGNSIISGDVTFKITNAAGDTVALFRNVAAAASGDVNTEAATESNLTFAAGTTCDTSITTTTGSCKDTPEVLAGGLSRAGATALIDVDSASTAPLATGTYTVTATHGALTLLKTVTATFVVAGPVATITIAGDAAIDIGGQGSITATLLDSEGNPVADQTAIGFETSNAVITTLTTAGTVSDDGVTTGGASTMTILGLAGGSVEVFGIAGGKVGSLTIVVGTAAPATPAAVTVTVSVLTAPPAGGFTQGAAGTTDRQAFADAQTFTVVIMWRFDVATQGWLSFIPATDGVAAPEIAQTMKTLSATDIISAFSK